jgi:hypothetical protein
MATIKLVSLGTKRESGFMASLSGAASNPILAGGRRPCSFFFRCGSAALG